MTKEFLTNFRGILNNFSFLFFVFVFGFFSKQYIIPEAKYYFEQTQAFRVKDDGFAFFILLILVFDTVGFILKYPHVRHLFFKNRYRKEMGLLDALMVPFFSASTLIHFVGGILLGMLLTRSTDNEIIKTFGVLVILAREILILIQLIRILNKMDGKQEENIPVPKDISLQKNIVSDVLLGICSAIFFTITWEATFGGMSGAPGFYTSASIFGMCWLSLMFYMPSRIIFIMQDYYSAVDAKYKWLALLSSIVVPMLVSVFVL